MSDRIGSEYHTNSSATFSGVELGKVIAVGGFLSAITVLAMVLFVDTPLAAFAVWAYTDAFGAPFTGLIIFGIGLTAARYYGIKSVVNENIPIAVASSLLAVIVYGMFGGMILQMYSSAIWLEAIAITGAITVLITMAAGAYVHKTEKDLSGYADISGALMLIGLVLYGLYTLVTIQAIMLIAFVFIVIGFIFDLIFEIWATSDGRRTPVANGIAIYIAFIGVFVHILQWVLAALGDS